MMTGKDLILYILMNDLEDVPVLDDGRFIGFMTEDEAAVKFGVTTATVRVWINQGTIEGYRINENIYIPCDTVNPMLRKE